MGSTRIKTPGNIRKPCSKEEIVETQITSENEMQPEAVPGVGEWQSKLAELLQYNQKMVGDAFLYSKKRRDVSARALQAGFVAIDALRENSRLLVTYFKDHDIREAYAKDLYERLVK